MSDSQDDDIRGEIQDLLKQINEDMSKLKNEISSIHELVDENSQFLNNVKMVNEKLIITAKEAGIDLENIEGEEPNDLEDCEVDVEELSDVPINSNLNDDVPDTSN